jgi:ABC-2 type transport system ATP-binding protein
VTVHPSGDEVSFGGAERDELGFGGAERDELGFGGAERDELGFGGAERDEVSFGGAERDEDDRALGPPVPLGLGRLRLGLRRHPAVTADPPPVDGLALASRGLTKRFRNGQLAVDGLDLAVPTGSVYGFLGPNGSGKTTTIRMLLGLIQPTAGTYQVLGFRMPDSLTAALSRVGSLVEGPAFYPQLSGRANLARLDAVDRTADPATAPARVSGALDRVGLLAAADKRYRAYSLGMKQRLAIASSLLRPRELVILDEPTNGLDPQGTREVRALIRQIAADGATVFVSSHLLAEVEQICTHVGVMRSGRMVFSGPLADLRGGARRVLVRTPQPELAAKVMAELGLAGITESGQQVSADLGALLPEVICERLVRAGVPVAGLETPGRSLEDEFVELTGEGFNVDG